MRFSAVFGVFALTGLSACGSALTPAKNALEEGRVPAALAELRQLEPSVGDWDRRRQARYALVRGLAELGMGNAYAADRWLAEAWRADRSDGECFAAAERGALAAARRALGRSPGEPGEPLRTRP